MNNKQEILNEFGKILVENTYDDGIKYFKQILNYNTKWGHGKDYSDMFNRLENEDQKILQDYLHESFSTMLFSFMKIFEESEKFRLMYKQEGESIDLNELSEMLKSEPIIEGGWIERFSKELKKDA